MEKNKSLKKFTTGDLHFGHKNIMKYEKIRNFSSIEEMDNYLIKKWNSIVGKEDHTFVVGDVSFYDDEKTKECIERLNGFKHLIIGNHDKDRTWQKWIKMGFNSVQSEIILDASKDIRFKFCHYPYAGDNSFEGRFIDKRPVKQDSVWLIHGHMHSQGSKFDEINKQVCVSTELWNFSPVNLDNIMALIRKSKK